MSYNTNRSKRTLVSLLVMGFFALAGWRVHIRVQTTMIGYELGRLKNDEAALLENRSLLKMELAKLKTKSHLLLASSYDELQPGSPGRLAQN